MYAYDDKGYLLIFYEGYGFILTLQDKNVACVISAGSFIDLVRKVDI
jgi:hypothetical protein